MDEAPLAAILIERRFTFSRYFINPKRLAARKNLALPCDPKAVPSTTYVFLATDRVQRNQSAVIETSHAVTLPL